MSGYTGEKVMRALRRFGRFFKNFMIVFSFVVNLVLVIVVVALIATIFSLKNDVVTPLVAGLHSSFVGLGRSDHRLDDPGARHYPG